MVKNVIDFLFTPPTEKLRPPPLVPHPLTVWAFVLVTIAGGAVLAGADPTASVAVLPAWGYDLYGVMLVFGGLAGLVGLLMRDWRLGLIWERTSLISLVPALGLYSLLSVLVLGADAHGLGVLAVMGLFVGATVRLVQIIRFMRGLHIAANL